MKEKIALKIYEIINSKFENVITATDEQKVTSTPVAEDGKDEFGLSDVIVILKIMIKEGMEKKYLRIGDMSGE